MNQSVLSISMLNRCHNSCVNCTLDACSTNHVCHVTHLRRQNLNGDLFADILEEEYVPAMREWDCFLVLGDNDSTHHDAKANAVLEDHFDIRLVRPPPPCRNPDKTFKKVCTCDFPTRGFWFPAKLPECNPAEHLCNWIQLEVDRLGYAHGYDSKLTLLALMKRRVHQAVKNLPKDYCQKLFRKMPVLINRLYEAKGKRFNTK